MAADERRRLELEQEFAEINRRISDNHKGIRRSLGRLRTLVIGHYADVHTLLRVHEFQIHRIEEKLGIPHEVPQIAPQKRRRKKKTGT